MRTLFRKIIKLQSWTHILKRLSLIELLEYKMIKFIRPLIRLKTNRKTRMVQSTSTGHQKRTKKGEESYPQKETNLIKSRKWAAKVRRIASQSETPSLTKMTSSKKITKVTIVSLIECNISRHTVTTTFIKRWIRMLTKFNRIVLSIRTSRTCTIITITNTPTATRIR